MDNSGEPPATPPRTDALGPILAAIDSVWPWKRFSEVTSLVAVSGGADSVAMLRALVHRWPSGAPGRLVVAHFNHRLRGASSDGDERFVSQLARQLGVEVEVQRATSTEAASSLTASEESLRAERYAFFDSAARRWGARYVALAHTADDNLETLLHNLFRGTGPAGLAGMPRFRPLGPEAVLVRPLLDVRREQLRGALRALGQAWREDASNADDRWSRNWLRVELLPHILRRYPHADGAILRTLAQQGELIVDLQDQAQRFAEQSIQSRRSGDQRGEALEIARTLWTNADPPSRQAVVMALRAAWDDQRWPRGAMAARHWSTILEMLEQGTPSHANLPGRIRARVEGQAKVVVERLEAD